MALALELNPQQIDDIALRQYRVEIMRALNSHFADGRRHQRRRAAHDDFGSQLQKTMNVAPGHPAMRDVSDQAHGQPGHVLFDLPNRENVEQALGGMLVQRRRRR